MALVATAKQSGGDFKQVSAGTHLARIHQIIDLGVHKTNYKDKDGNDKFAHKVRIGFEIPGELLDDGRPLTTDKEFNLSMGTIDGKYKSDLRKSVESLFGRELSVDEVKSFDVTTLVGTPAMVTILHVPSKKDPSKKYAQITSMSSVPKGVPVPDAINNPVVFSISDFDQEVFDSLSEFVQKKIALPAGVVVSGNADADVDPAELLK